ncbi:MAG: proprotein convertase P-domain-containing protein [Sandaracinaceae bacterium]|nr:proprotein convertase P-domain-containing protein [Sandaracinaceae bacterium]
MLLTRAMRNVLRAGWSPFPFLSVALCLAGCAAGVGDRSNSFVDLESHPPLSSFAELSAGAPTNAELPADDKTDLVFPARFDLVADQSPVRNQGQRGVCAMFSTASLVESMYRRSGLLPNADFSEQYLIWLVKAKYERGTLVSGSGPTACVGSIHEFGIPLETLWPYESTPWTAEHDPACNGNDGEDGLPSNCYTNGEAPLAARRATQYSIPVGRPINSGSQSIKSHLTDHRSGVLLAARFFERAWNYAASTDSTRDYRSRGYVLYPDSAERASGARGAHQVLIVGWDDALEVQQLDASGRPAVDGNGDPIMQRGFFLFKNSWGTNGFGVNNPMGAGYGWISYKYAEDFCTAFVINDLTAENAMPPLRTGTTTDSTTGNRYIADNDPAGALMSVPVSRPGITASVTVSVDITHERPQDLVITLISPNSHEFILQSHADSIATSFTEAGVAGDQAGGPWRVRVVDSVTGAEGTFNGWSITVNRTEGL